MRRNVGRSHIFYLVLLFAALLLFFVPEQHVSALRGRAVSTISPLLERTRTLRQPNDLKPALIVVPSGTPTTTAAPNTAAETEKIRNDAERADRLQAENIFLRNELNRLLGAMPGATPPPIVHPGLHADVISRRILWQEPILAINRGTAHGVQTHAGVLYRGAVLGRVTDAGAGASTIALITHRGMSVSARLIECRQEGVLQGIAVEEGAERLCRLSLVGRECHAKEGEQVVTSGFDGVFPAGLWIGVVIKVNKIADVQWEVLVRPACDESRVESVQVLTGSTPQVPWPEMPTIKRKN
jgi:cell shape-determining protein MreC